MKIYLLKINSCYLSVIVANLTLPDIITTVANSTVRFNNKIIRLAKLGYDPDFYIIFPFSKTVLWTVTLLSTRNNAILNWNNSYWNNIFAFHWIFFCIWFFSMCYFSFVLIAQHCRLCLLIDILFKFINLHWIVFHLAIRVIWVITLGNCHLQYGIINCRVFCSQYNMKFWESL